MAPSKTARFNVLPLLRASRRTSGPLLGIAALVAFCFADSPQLRAADPIPVDLAIEEMQALLATSPSADGYNDIGNLHELAGERSIAEASYRQALELDPEHTEALYNLGLLLQQNERWKEAQRLFKQVVKNDPESAWGHFQLGMSQHERGNQRAAVNSFLRAFELDAYLAFPDVNPQLFDNNSATIALLKMQSTTTGEAVPRRYARPVATASLLIGKEDSGDDQAPELTVIDEGAETSRVRTGGATGSVRPDDDSGPEAVFEVDEDAPRDPTEPSTSSRSQRSDESSSRILSSSSLPGGSRTTGSSSTRPNSGRPSGSTTTNSGRSVTRPTSSRFRPGRRSSARIEWELSPLPKASTTSVTPAP